MAKQRLGLGSRGVSQFGGIVIGDPSGSTVGTLMEMKRFSQGTFTANTSSVPQSSIETATFTLTGASTGDLVLVQPSTALEAGLSLSAMAVVTAANTVTVTFINETSAAVVQTSGLTNKYFFIKIT